MNSRKYGADATRHKLEKRSTLAKKDRLHRPPDYLAGLVLEIQHIVGSEKCSDVTFLEHVLDVREQAAVILRRREQALGDSLVIRAAVKSFDRSLSTLCATGRAIRNDDERSDYFKWLTVSFLAFRMLGGFTFTPRTAAKKLRAQATVPGTSARQAAVELRRSQIAKISAGAENLKVENVMGLLERETGKKQSRSTVANDMRELGIGMRKGKNPSTLKSD